MATGQPVFGGKDILRFVGSFNHFCDWPNWPCSFLYFCFRGTNPGELGPKLVALPSELGSLSPFGLFFKLNILFVVQAN